MNVPNVPSVPLDPLADPLVLNQKLAHGTELPVLGRRVVFESNSSAVLEAVDRSFGIWARLPESLRDSAPVCRVRLFVEDGEESATRPALRYMLPEPNRLIFSTGKSVGVAEVDRGEAYAFVTTGLVACDTHFRYGVIEALTLNLVTGTGRHPVHAATVVRNGKALLLAGPSGVGKSTLAYAASRAGLEVRGDEAAYVQLRPALRLWGMPGRVRLSTVGAAHFPELSEVPPVSWVNGKPKVVVDFDVGEGALRPVERVVVCLLSEGDGPARVERVEASVVFDFLTSRVESGFDLNPAEGKRVAEQLAGNGGWRVQLSDNPFDAVPLIEEMLEN